MTTDLHENVSKYYGETVQKTEDLEYSACCVTDYDSGLLERLTDEVLDKRYGCGSPLPDGLEGLTVLDLGCGAGADCFMASQLVGPEGRVIGLDMTAEQLDVARRNIQPHMENFGFEEPNVEFTEGRIESIPLDDASVDVVISNCVINLSPDKQAVYDEIWRVLKPGGEFFVSDIVADRRTPEHMRQDPKLWGECLSGALYERDLERVEAQAGFRDVRVCEASPTGDVVEGVRFASQIRRGFKLDLEPTREDYGQVAVYQGTIDGSPEAWEFDAELTFAAGEPVRVSGNTADMLTESRFSKHFQVSQPMRHLGSFDAPEQDRWTDDSTSCC
jgi:SAM-dependent methyltransferase